MSFREPNGRIASLPDRVNDETNRTRYSKHDVPILGGQAGSVDRSELPVATRLPRFSFPRIVERAPRLHKMPITEPQVMKLAVSLMHRYWRMRQKR